MLWRVSSPRHYPAGFIEPCLPTVRSKPPSGPEWIHEIKHDGYRMIVRRDRDRVRLFTRRGHDWTHRFGWIVHALQVLRVKSVTLDGEMVVCDDDGISVFAKLHSQSYDGQAFLYAFDLLELNGNDYRREPLEKRKAKLAKLLARAEPGIRLNEHVEDDGADIFRHACKLGLEGIVSKRRGFPYRSGRCKSWIKVKNPTSPAMMRVEDGTF